MWHSFKKNFKKIIETHIFHTVINFRFKNTFFFVNGISEENDSKDLMIIDTFLSQNLNSSNLSKMRSDFQTKV